METFWIRALQLILSLSILVIVHEFGHFIAAKIFKARVEKFYLFFNPKFSLFKFKKGDTEYGIGWIPLGGYVKISGMIDESMDVNQMKKEPEPWEFRSKPAWQRLIIMLAGIFMNILLACLIYIGILWCWGKSYLPVENVKHGIVCSETFQDMGIRNGDLIVALDSNKVEDFYQIVPDILLNKPQTMQIKRGDSLINIDVPETVIAGILRQSTSSNRVPLIGLRILMETAYVGGFADYSPAYDAGIRKEDKILSVNGHNFVYYDEFTAMLDTMAYKKVDVKLLRGQDTVSYAFTLGTDAKFGLMFGFTEHFDYATRTYSFLESIPAGISEGWNALVSYIKQIGLLFTPNSNAYKGVGGVMTIGSIFPPVWDWQAFWTLTAFISIMLGVVNVLPIPALDGGHALFTMYEIITRRKPGDKFMERAQITGMLLLLALFILSNVNDIIRFFGK